MSAFFKNLDLSTVYKKKRKLKRTRKNANPFPMKLYKMLQDSPEKGWEDIVSWAPDGLSFHVHDADRFMTDVLPAYFNQTKFKSFQRQLNFYGFHRNVKFFAYSHRYLIRGNQEMCKKIIRTVGQDKPLQKESSSTSSSPSTSPSSPRKTLTQQGLDLHQPLPALSVMSDEEISLQNDFEQDSLASDFVDPTAFLVQSQSDSERSFPTNFDDTPISLEDAVSFGGVQFDLLSGLEEIMSM